MKREIKHAANMKKEKYWEQKYLDSHSAPDRPGRYIAEILSQFISGSTDLRLSGVTSKLPAAFVSAYAISTALKSPMALQHNNYIISKHSKIQKLHSNHKDDTSLHFFLLFNWDIQPNAPIEHTNVI